MNASRLLPILVLLSFASCSDGSGGNPCADLPGIDQTAADFPIPDVPPAEDGSADPSPVDTPSDLAKPDLPMGDATASDSGLPSWTACENAGDCVVLELGCCDHCNGGTALAVNKTFQAEALAALRARDCDETDCTTLACGPVQPTCTAGTCGLEETGRGPCDGLDEAACKSSPDCVPIFGAPVDEVCQGDYSKWSTLYAGCGPRATCSWSERCATDSKTGTSLVVTSDCLPDGWTGCSFPCEFLGCADGNPHSFSKICIHGETSGEGEVVEAGHPITISARPTGCHSSSCTTTWKAVCSLEGKTDLVLKGVICLEALGQECTADCGGGDSATCGSAPLGAGKYTIWYLDDSVSFEVPGTLPKGGLCFGGV